MLLDEVVEGVVSCTCVLCWFFVSGVVAVEAGLFCVSSNTQIGTGADSTQRVLFDDVVEVGVDCTCEYVFVVGVVASAGAWLCCYCSLTDSTIASQSTSRDGSVAGEGGVGCCVGCSKRSA